MQNILNKPLPGTNQPKPQSQVDDSSLLDTIKDFLTQSLPGTKDDQEQPHQPTAVSESPIPANFQDDSDYESDDRDDQEGEGEWFALKSKQTQEREELHRRHELEREAMQRRHEEDRENIKYRREKDREETKHKREMEHEARKQAREHGKRGKGHGRGKG